MGNSLVVAAGVLLASAALYVGTGRSDSSGKTGDDAGVARTTAEDREFRSFDTPQPGAPRLSPKSERRADAHERQVAARNRVACVANIRNVQQAMRSHQNMNGFFAGDAGYRKADLFGPKSFIESQPSCPSGGRYDWADGTFPRVGDLALRCSHAGHVPISHEDW